MTAKEMYYQNSTQLKFSQTKDDVLTFGYGTLNPDGTWEYPLGYDDLTPTDKMKVDHWYETRGKTRT